MENKIIALKINDMDNVATVFGEVNIGTPVKIRDKKGNEQVISSKEDIPYGHKMALCDIEKGMQITKYGEEIGQATANIKIGECVHVHNLESIRARGDWEKGDKK